MIKVARDKDDLIDIINEVIAEEGINADLNYIDTSLIDDMSNLFECSIINSNYAVAYAVND
jgi:hypothetical protein